MYGIPNIANVVICDAQILLVSLLFVAEVFLFKFKCFYASLLTFYSMIMPELRTCDSKSNDDWLLNSSHDQLASDDNSLSITKE